MRPSLGLTRNPSMLMLSAMSKNSVAPDQESRNKRNEQERAGVNCARPDLTDNQPREKIREDEKAE